MAGYKNGWAKGGGTGHPLQPDVGSLSRIHPKFLFSMRKKNETADGSGRNGGGEEKREGARRRVGCLEIGVGKKGGGRKRHDKNNGLEQEEKEDGITRGTIVGRKILNNRRRGGWKRGEIRSEREDLESSWVWNGIRVRIRR